MTDLVEKISANLVLPASSAEHRVVPDLRSLLERAVAALGSGEGMEVEKVADLLAVMEQATEVIGKAKDVTAAWLAAQSMPEAGNDFFDFMAMMPEPKVFTKQELLDEVRKNGFMISDRQLTTYVTEGIVPKSVRVGSRQGVFPAAVARLLHWVGMVRDDRGISLESTKELVPAWKFARRARCEGVFDVAAFELVVRENLISKEAMYALPSVFHAEMWCPDCIQKMEFRLKDGTITRHTDAKPFSLSFEMFSQDSAGEYKSISSTRVTFPSHALETDPGLVVVGIPLDVPVPARKREVADGC